MIYQKIQLYKTLFKNKLDIGYQDHLSADDPLHFTDPNNCNETWSKILGETYYYQQ